MLSILYSILWTGYKYIHEHEDENDGDFFPTPLQTPERKREHY